MYVCDFEVSVNVTPEVVDWFVSKLLHYSFHSLQCLTPRVAQRQEQAHSRSQRIFKTSENGTTHEVVVFFKFERRVWQFAVFRIRKHFEIIHFFTS